MHKSIYKKSRIRESETLFLLHKLNINEHLRHQKHKIYSWASVYESRYIYYWYAAFTKNRNISLHHPTEQLTFSISPLITQGIINCFNTTQHTIFPIRMFQWKYYPELNNIFFLLDIFIKNIATSTVIESSRFPLSSILRHKSHSPHKKNTELSPRRK